MNCTESDRKVDPWEKWTTTNLLQKIDKDKVLVLFEDDIKKACEHLKNNRGSDLFCVNKNGTTLSKLPSKNRKEIQEKLSKEKNP
jgi:predicted RNA-binding protein